LAAGGPGGPALLYCTRRNLLYTVFLAHLSAYAHRELTQASADGPSARRMPQ